MPQFDPGTWLLILVNGGLIVVCILFWWMLGEHASVIEDMGKELDAMALHLNTHLDIPHVTSQDGDWHLTTADDVVPEDQDAGLARVAGRRWDQASQKYVDTHQTGRTPVSAKTVTVEPRLVTRDRLRDLLCDCGGPFPMGINHEPNCYVQHTERIWAALDPPNVLNQYRVPIAPVGDVFGVDRDSIDEPWIGIIDAFPVAPATNAQDEYAVDRDAEKVREWNRLTEPSNRKADEA